MTAHVIVRLWRGLLLVCLCAAGVHARSAELAHEHTIGPDIGANATLVGPFGISLSRNNEVLISDDLGHRVYHLDASFDLVRTLGAEQGFAYTDAALLRPDRSYVIADTGNNRLLFLNAQGKIKRTVTTLGWFKGKLANPRSLAIGADSHFLIADWGNETVRVLDQDGALVRTIGGRDSGAGGLRGPIDALELPTGEIIVSDHRRHRLLRFSAAGEPSGIIGAPGSGPGGLRGPSGLALGPEGTIWVADTLNARIMRFAENGEPLGAYWAGPGAAFSKPADLAFASDGRLLVADAGRHVVYVFAPPVNPPTSDK